MPNIASDFHAAVEIKFGDLADMMNWCKSNCRDSWTVTIDEDAGADPGKYTFHFLTETDYVTFLMWKS